MASKLTHLLNIFAFIFLCNYTNSCLASSRLLLDIKKPSTIQFGVDDQPSLLKPTFPTPEITQTPPFSYMLPSLQVPLTTPPPPPPPPSPTSPLPKPNPLLAKPSPPVLANFGPMPFPFPHYWPLPKFPPFPFIPTMPSVPSLPVPSGFISSPSKGEEGSP